MSSKVSSGTDAPTAFNALRTRLLPANSYISGQGLLPRRAFRAVCKFRADPAVVIGVAGILSWSSYPLAGRCGARPGPGARKSFEGKRWEMRIVATAMVIAIAAASAGCGGGSSSSPRAHSQTLAQTTSVPTRSAATSSRHTAVPTGSAATSIRHAAARTKPAAASTKTTSGSRRGAHTVPTHPAGGFKSLAKLVGRPLDVARRMLQSAGISYKVIPLHGHANNAAAQWGVCETAPMGGKFGGSGGIGLIVARLKCGATLTSR